MSTAKQPAPQGPKYPLDPTVQRRLQMQFQAGAQQAAKGQYDYATTMFKMCVIADPRNEKYVEQFLGNLQKKFGQAKPNSTAATMATAATRTLMQKSRMSKAWYDLLKQGFDVIEKNPFDIGILLELAVAARQLEYDDSELVFLRAAVNANIKDPTANRRLADCLDRREDFEGAITCWERVRAAEPKDVEIPRVIHNLTVKRQIQKNRMEEAKSAKDLANPDEPAKGRKPLDDEQKLKKELEKNPKDVAKMVELARLYEKEERYADCEKFLSECVEKSGGDLNLVEQLELMRLRIKRNEVVQLRAARDENRTPDNIERWKQAEKELFLFELDYYRTRVERYPTNLDYRVELAARFEKGGKPRDAIAHYQKGLGDAQRKGEVLMGLARCFLKIEQPKLSYQHFKQAVDAIPPNGEQLELHKEALYQAGVTAKATKDVGAAKDYLSRLAGLDFSYKDVGDLLDKIDMEADDEGAATAGGK